jgi:Protein of unknown function (DUF4235)
MSKIFFAPFAMIGGLIAGLIGRRLYKVAWARVDGEQPPAPGDRDAAWGRVVFSLLLQGAIFTASRGVVDRLLRKGFSRLTGFWPGEKRPKAA